VANDGGTGVLPGRRAGGLPAAGRADGLARSGRRGLRRLRGREARGPGPVARSVHRVLVRVGPALPRHA